jgi:hypothetical protein
MEAITINVNKQMDGYTFSIAPSIRQMIKGWFPDAHPANNIFVAYDTKSNFEAYYGTLESHIYPALLGVDSNTDLRKKVDEILFIDSQTGKVLHRHKVAA